MGEPVTLRGATTLSRLGSVFSVFAVVWTFAGLILAEYLSTLFVARGARPGWLTFLVIAQAFLPLAVVFAARRLGRRRPFRWLLAWPQPAATLDDQGMELCLPGRGCERFGWDEIGRLVPSSLTPRERWVRTVSLPRSDLCGPDGRVLATLPYSIVFPPPTGGLRSRRVSLAELVVARRPERFALLRPPGILDGFLSFALFADAPPAWEIESAIRRNRTITWLLIGGLGAFTVIGLILANGGR